MKNILLAMMLVFSVGSLRAIDIDLDKVEVDYLCQAMLVRIPTAAAQALTDSSTDPWSSVTTQLASGEATLISAPAFTTKTGQRALCESKNATLEIEPTTKDSGSCEIVMSFKSTELKYDSPGGGVPFDLGRSRVLTSGTVANDPTKSIVLLFRVLKPVGKSE